MSKHFRTKLVIVHGFILLQAAREAELVRSRPSSQRLDLMHDLSLTAELLKAGEGKAETALLAGDPCVTIPAFAQSRHPSLLVLGTHGHGSLDRFILGSTAEAILRHSSRAVLTVGPQVNLLRAGELNIRRILYATDCSPESAHAAPTAVALCDAFEAELDVLNVLSSPWEQQQREIDRTKQHFSSAVATFLPGGSRQIVDSSTFVSVGEPQKEIQRHIENRKIDLLVLGLRRSTHLGMQNRTAGAFPIIAASSCPVVTVALGPVTVTQLVGAK